MGFYNRLARGVYDMSDATKKEETPKETAQFSAGGALDKAHREFKKFPTVQNEEALLKAAQVFRAEFLKAFTNAVK